MALFFNIQKLEEQACNDNEKFMWMLWYHYSGRLPHSKTKFKPAKVPLVGNSFLLNPQALFNDNTTDSAHWVQYVKLAGRRDYLLYKQYGYRDLQTSFFPDINYEAIKHNPLLKITPTEISFKYEKD